MTQHPQTDATAQRGRRRKPAPVDPDLLDDEPDQLARVGVYLVIAVALAVSGKELVYLAQAAGWHGKVGYALPVLLDVTGAIAGRIAYRRKRTRPSTRAYAKRILYGTLIASVIGNTVSHMDRAGWYNPGPELVIVVSFVAPLAAAAMLHLTTLLSPAGRTAPVAVPVQTDQTAPAAPEKPASKPASQPDTKPDTKPESKPADGPDRPEEADRTAPDRSDESGPDQPERTVVPDDEAVRIIRELDALAGEPVSDRAIRAAVNCGAQRAKKLAEQARAIHLAA
jgi:hypothetical protein